MTRNSAKEKTERLQDKWWNVLEWSIKRYAYWCRCVIQPELMRFYRQDQGKE